MTKTDLVWTRLKFIVIRSWFVCRASEQPDSTWKLEKRKSSCKEENELHLNPKWNRCCLFPLEIDVSKEGFNTTLHRWCFYSMHACKYPCRLLVRRLTRSLYKFKQLTDLSPDNTCKLNQARNIRVRYGPPISIPTF